jgi:hypothetical protein
MDIKATGNQFYAPRRHKGHEGIFEKCKNIDLLLLKLEKIWIFLCILCVSALRQLFLRLECL